MQNKSKSLILGRANHRQTYQSSAAKMSLKLNNEKEVIPDTYYDKANNKIPLKSFRNIHNKLSAPLYNKDTEINNIDNTSIKETFPSYSTNNNINNELYTKNNNENSNLGISSLKGKINQLKFKNNNDLDNSEINDIAKNLRKVNILMRVTYRPNYFNNCINSILIQTYKNIHIYICYDDDNCLEYLNKYMTGYENITIFKVIPKNKNINGFYNLYCNELLERVNNGWIFFLDDDNYLTNPHVIEFITNRIKNQDTIYFWQVKIGGNIIYPSKLDNIKKYSIDTAGFMFNYKYKSTASWEAVRGGDYKFITNLLNNNPTINRDFIPIMAVSTQHKLNGLLGFKDIPKSINNLYSLISFFNCKNILISNSLQHFSDTICNKFNLSPLYDINSNSCIFFGLYTSTDIQRILMCNTSNIILILGGSDVPNITHILPKIDRVHVISISMDIYNRLKDLNIKSTLIEFNLVDKNLFYPRESTDNYIYIYDGYYKNNSANKKIYGKNYYDKIIKRLPNEKFIFSSQLNKKYEEMPNIYAKCKIGLRLTENDGNANTVQEFEAMNLPIVHNQSKYGLKWKTIDDIIGHIREYLLCNMKHFNCINIENNLSYHELISNTNGDNINETNFVNNIIKNNITLYFNNKFITGNSKLTPQITISRNKNYDQLINKTNVFLSSIPYKKECDGLYFITKSMINAIKDKNSLLYPHVYDDKLFYELNKKTFFLNEQVIHKDWYNWATDDKIKQLKLKYFPEDAFVICICGRIAINSYPKSLLEAIKILRNQGHNIHLLALTKFEVSPHRLTQELYNEITSYDWVKSFTVDKKEILNYFRFCDILASTYRDYCNHVGGSNKIKEYLLCNKPIICSRGKERENELGKDYFGFYDSKTCDSVPPLCWTQEFIRNPDCYHKQYETYFKRVDLSKEINQIVNIINVVLNKELIIIITTYQRNEILLNYVNLLLNQSYKKKYHIIIIDDNPSNNLIFNESNIYYNINIKNYGTNEYFKNFCKNIKMCAFFTDKYIFSPDDIIIDYYYIENIIKYWNEINDINKIALTLYNDRNLSWTNKINEHYNNHIDKCYWQETLFICDNVFIEKYKNFDLTFNKPRSLKSSGVPRFFSINNYNDKKNMYVIKKNIINNIGMFSSKMNVYDINNRIFTKYNKYIINILIICDNNSLHFLQPYINYISNINFINLKIDNQYTLVSNKNSIKHFNNNNYLNKLKTTLDTFNPDIIFCEFGNYLLCELSKIKKPHQKLICRFHRFDIYLQIDMKKLWNIKWENIDLIICISKYFEEIINKNFFGFKNIITINNYFELNNNDINIDNQNIYNIGIIGIEKEVKRLDLAVIILNKLQKLNNNFKLYSKGHKLNNLNIEKRIQEFDLSNYYYEGHSNNNNISVDQWIINNNISHIISVSDIESFHYSIISAINNNCNYYITNWVDIAKTMWRIENIYDNIDDLITGIIKYNSMNKYDKIDYLKKNKEQCLKINIEKNDEYFLNRILLEN